MTSERQMAANKKIEWLKKFKEEILAISEAVRYSQSAQSTIALTINYSNNFRKVSEKCP